MEIIGARAAAQLRYELCNFKIMSSEHTQEVSIINQQTNVNPKKVSGHILIPPATSELVSQIFEKAATSEYNIGLARQIVLLAKQNNILTDEQINNNTFPGTDIPLAKLLDPQSKFINNELVTSENTLIQPLMEVFNMRSVDEKENKIHPAENQRPFENYGTEWLKKKLETPEVVNATPLQPDLT